MKKKLTRSLTQRKIAGVCGGLGEYLGITPSIYKNLPLLQNAIFYGIQKALLTD